MNGKVDKFTAARIRLFQTTGMAVQKPLPFDRPRFGVKPQLMMALPAPAQAGARAVSRQQQAS